MPTYTFGEETTTTIKCPFCNQGDVRHYYKPSFTKQNTTTTVGGRRAKTATRSAEVNEVLNDCPVCGKTKKDIESKLKKPNEEPSKQSVLERLKASGLPTKI